jgi:flagellar biosynthesis protein FliQ
MIAVIQEALMVVLLVSGVPLATCAVSGLAIALLQAVTQVQEQTITYVVKIVTFALTLMVTYQWSCDLMSDLSVKLFEGIAHAGRLP